MSKQRLTKKHPMPGLGSVSKVQPKDGVCSLRGFDIQRIIEEEFDTTYTLNGVYRLLHRLGYSSLMLRPGKHRPTHSASSNLKKILDEPALLKAGTDKEVQVMRPGLDNKAA